MQAFFVFVRRGFCVSRVRMEALLKRWTDALLEWLGLTTVLDGWSRWVAFLLVLLVVILFDYLCRIVVVRLVRPIVERTRVRWDDELFSRAVLCRLCHILSASVLLGVLPVVFSEKDLLREVVFRLTGSYFTIAIFRFVDAVICSLFSIMTVHPAWLGKPLKGLRQTARGIALLVCVIIIIAILIHKSPMKLLTGLGASAAIVLLIFKDSIQGFVSGIQLTANDMLKVGDWIAVPKFGADGQVEEVTLSTVKIRNWDNTITTLPPYMLVSDSFQNWRAMQLTGGRRVMRYVSIDMTSVRFCTAAMLHHYRQIELVRDFVEQTQQQTGERQLTNLTVFRAYLVNYLQKVVPVNPDMILMVRQLQPTPTGIPLELYFFTNTVEWIAYEGIQSDVFDHVLAVMPEFGLRVFQSPTGAQLAALLQEKHQHELDDDDPQKHADGIDRGIGDRGVVAVDRVVGVVEGHGVGHATAEHAADRPEVEPLDTQGKEGDQHHRNNRQGKAQSQPQSPLGTHHRVKKVSSGIKSQTGQIHG